MSYNWRELFDFSKNIINDPENPGPKEAALRSAISRTYYSAYHCALNYATGVGYASSKSGSNHHNLINYLEESSDPKVKFLGIYLGRLFEARKDVDYEDSFKPPVARKAMISLGNANFFFSTLDSITSAAKSEKP